MAKATQKIEAQAVESNEVQKTEVPARDMQALATKHNNVKSKMIRELHADGVKTSEITKLMQTLYPKFIYQHARNVLNTNVKKQA